MFRYIAFASAALLIPVASAQTQRTVPAADEAAGPLASDGGPALNAPLGELRGVALDAAGNLYIADRTGSRIRKVTPAGIITTAAGNGTRGFSGDGGPAINAQINTPSALGLDAMGNLYIADRDNGRIRKVAPNGIITTVAGNGMQGYSGDGGPAIAAKLGDPRGVVPDAAGNLYVTDSSNNRIRKIVQGGIITTVAGKGTEGFSGDGGPALSAEFNTPGGVALDASGNLFISDRLNSRIRKVTAAGIMTTAAGNGSMGFSGDGGPATSAALGDPRGIAVDASGNLYIADRSNGRIRKVTPSGTITTIAGNGSMGFSGDGGPAASAGLNNPSDVAVDSKGNLFIADFDNSRIRKVTPDGVITTVAGNGPHKPTVRVPAPGR